MEEVFVVNKRFGSSNDSMVVGVFSSHENAVEFIQLDACRFSNDEAYWLSPDVFVRKLGHIFERYYIHKHFLNYGLHR